MAHVINTLLSTVASVRGAGLWLLGLLLAGGLHAQGGVVEPELHGLTQRWVDQAMAAAQASGPTPLRMEVSVGALDSRLRLAACTQIEPYLPPGTRLWGRTRLGLRCLDGGVRWNVFLPVTIKAFGPAWVVKGSVAAGAVLTETDMLEAEVDWAQEASAIVFDQAMWLGQVAARPLSTGQALRQGMFRPAQVFAAGTQVRVVAQGPGFQITSDGQALSAGVVGQATRVKMDNGRIMSATVLDLRTVRVDL
ncbi:MAG: flagellar basal body P-ring formation chaperone FlgA [Hylemonella sp.]|nr:flagellar basal body P-ring formation chaperone FlgA [Hylemonella sp.]